jgi:hypothetical protein
LASASNGLAVLDSVRSPIIHGDQIPWDKYLKPADKERVIPAEAIAESSKQEMLSVRPAKAGSHCLGKRLVAGPSCAEVH